MLLPLAGPASVQSLALGVGIQGAPSSCIAPNRTLPFSCTLFGCTGSSRLWDLACFEGVSFRCSLLPSLHSQLCVVMITPELALHCTTTRSFTGVSTGSCSNKASCPTLGYAELPRITGAVLAGAASHAASLSVLAMSVLMHETPQLVSTAPLLGDCDIPSVTKLKPTTPNSCFYRRVISILSLAVFASTASSFAADAAS